MKLSKRIKLAFNTLRDKSTRETIELNHLMDFLGLRDTDDKVLSEATYFACMKVLSEAIGKLPLKLLQYNDRNGVSTARYHDLYNVVHDRPNPYMTSTTFWSTVEYNRNHYGNAYVLIEGGGKNTRLWILPSNQVEIWYDDAKILSDVPDIYYLYSAGGKVYKFGSEEILHFKTSNMFDGIVGISVQDQLKQTIQGNNKAQKMVNNMYDSGFTAKAVLQYTGSLNDENTQTFVKGIESYAKGKLKDRGIENIIPIPLGASLTPLKVDLADNQFIEVKQYTALQIASAFGIKPYQIGDYTKSSYASAEAQQLSFYVDTLLYIIKQYEEELTYKLLSSEEIGNGLHFKFNVAVILRADLQTQINSLSTAVNSFLYTPNEARALLDMESKEGGDELLGNGASIPVRYAGSQYTDLNGEENTPVAEETVETDPAEIISIIEAIRSGKISYDQGVALITVTIGYNEAIARELLGNPEDYEDPIEDDPDDGTGENPENDPDDNQEETPTGQDPEES
jgi:HK97 family phage portal protein